MRLSAFTPQEIVNHFEPETEREKDLFEKLSPFVELFNDQEGAINELIIIESNAEEETEMAEIEADGLRDDIEGLIKIIKKLDPDNEILKEFG